MKKGLYYVFSAKVLIAVIVGMTLIITAMLVAVIGMKKNKGGNDVANASSAVSTTSGQSNTASVDSDPSANSSGQTSSVISTASNQSNSSSTVSKTASSEYTVPNIDGLPNAGDDPFKDTTPANGRVCYLTFDDGPCANTNKILNILAENNVKATFFVVGTMSTNKIVDIYNAGHSVGLHTGSHDLSKVYANPEGFINDLKSISDTVYKKIGIRSNLTRFPGGSATAAMKKRLGSDGFETVTQLMEEQGYTYFDWNIDSGDTHEKSPSKSYVMNQVKKGLYKSNGELKSEVCILMHDIKGVTVEALPDIIAELKSLGYTFKRLDGSAPSFKFK